MKISTIVALAAMAFAVTLAIIIGQRLSTEAMAVLIGVLAGVLASVPTSLAVAYLAIKHWQPKIERPAPPQAAPPQPIVVSYPPTVENGYPSLPPAQPGYPSPAIPAYPIHSREYTVIGGDQFEEE